MISEQRLASICDAARAELLRKLKGPKDSKAAAFWIGYLDGVRGRGAGPLCGSLATTSQDTGRGCMCAARQSLNIRSVSHKSDIFYTEGLISPSLSV